MGAAAALGLFSAGMGLFGASMQHGVEKDRVNLAFEDNLEKIRRRGFTQETILGQAKARSQASGVLHTKGSGSTAQGVLDTMSKEFKKELDWMKYYGNRARKLGMRTADVNLLSNQLGAIGGGFNTASSVYGLTG